MKIIWNLVKLSQFNHINEMKTLNMITLSDAQVTYLQKNPI